MNTAYTPGPWAIRSADRAIVRADEPSRLVAHGGSIMPDDAALIAAAPDLLAALQAVLRYGFSGDTTAQAFDAIAKATQA